MTSLSRRNTTKRKMDRIFDFFTKTVVDFGRNNSFIDNSSTTSTSQNERTDLAVYTRREVAEHWQESDCWIIIGNKVYDVTRFLAKHPGGSGIISAEGGNDVTTIFHDCHDETSLRALDRYQVGVLRVANEP